MKIRKSLLAIATTATIITAGVTAEADAQELSSNLTALSSTSTESDDASEPEEGNANNSNTSNEGSSKDDAEAAKLWLGVATAAIGVASALFSFFAKNIAPLVFPK